MTLKKILLLLIALGLLGVAGGAAYVYAGIFNVAATEEHSTPTYYLLHYAMRRSVKARVGDVHSPLPLSRQRIEHGSALYRAHCLQCHGGPGIEPDPLGYGVRPLPANLVQAAREWPDNEVYWVVRYGIKMSAMPAWGYRLSDDDIWDVTAFVKQLPLLSPAEFKKGNPHPGAEPTATPTVTAKTSTGAVQQPLLGDVRAGRHAIDQYLCATCHRIPGVVGANTTVGPPLDGIARRKYIGGVLLNTPENMLRWLRDPQAVDPRSAMPNLHIREQDARDISAYLYTLKEVN